MERVINKENLSNFIITNEKYLSCSIEKIKGLAIEFPGFDGNSCLSGNYNNAELNNHFAVRLAEKGILLIYVFTGPWSWMRDVSVKAVDDIIDAVIGKYELPLSVKLVLTGGSMGGLSALSYNVYGKHKAVACAVSCPVCDLFAVEKTTPYFAASVYFACAHYTCSYEDAVKSLSPMYFIDRFPKNDYFFICCNSDTVIFPQENVIPLLQKMGERNLNVRVLELEDKDHCRHTSESINAFVDFITDSCKK